MLSVNRLTGQSACKTNQHVTRTIIGAKRMALSDDEPEKIADFIALKTA